MRHSYPIFAAGISPHRVVKLGDRFFAASDIRERRKERFQNRAFAIGQIPWQSQIAP